MPSFTSPISGSFATVTSFDHVRPPSTETFAYESRLPGFIVCPSAGNALSRLYVQTSFPPIAWIIGHEL